MLEDTNTFIQNVRSIYIKNNINFTHKIKISDLSNQVIEINDFLTKEEIDQYLAFTQKDDSHDVKSKGSQIKFTDKHNWLINNDQKIYCKNRIIEEISEELSRLNCNRINILSLGIGNGSTTHRYIINDVDRCCVTGMDLYNSYMRDAIGIIPNLEAIEFDFNSLSKTNIFPFADGRFDIIECVMVAHHVENLELLFKEVFRVLKPGGVFLYSDLIDKTEISKPVVFSSDHEYPDFHGVEFYRTHEYVKSLLINKYDLEVNRRIGPGYIIISARKMEC